MHEVSVSVCTVTLVKRTQDGWLAGWAAETGNARKQHAHAAVCTHLTVNDNQTAVRCEFKCALTLSDTHTVTVTVL